MKESNIVDIGQYHCTATPIMNGNNIRISGILVQMGMVYWLGIKPY
jgi:hypothetical protein